MKFCNCESNDLHLHIINDLTFDAKIMYFFQNFIYIHTVNAADIVHGVYLSQGRLSLIQSYTWTSAESSLPDFPSACPVVHGHSPCKTVRIFAVAWPLRLDHQFCLKKKKQNKTWSAILITALLYLKFYKLLAQKRTLENL